MDSKSKTAGPISTPKRHHAKSDGESTNMLLKIYSISILLLDIITVLVKVIAAILEAIYLKLTPVHEKSVIGEIVLVTGAGHGIGRELCLQLASLGSTIVCWDINEENNTNTVKELTKLGHKAYGFKCDVSNREEVFSVAKRVQEEVGEVTILINNAGIMPCQPFLDHTEQEIRKMFDINVLAHFWMMDAFLPNMIKNNHGHVVALSSMAGIMGIANLVPYCGSKYAVRGLMEAIIEELRFTGRALDVKFTTICPFIVDTGLCKKPRARFPSLLGILTPQCAAASTITALRRNFVEVSIPRGYTDINYILRLLPTKANEVIRDFFDTGVDAHDKV